MGAIIAGAAIAAVGAGVSAYGASQSASAQKDAAKYAALLEKRFADEQTTKLDTLITEKTNRLDGINTILEKYNGGGAFSSNDVLANIRKAQADTSALAAGDFTAFQGQLESIMKSTLAGTYGSGSPIGTFANLSASNIYNLRSQGLNSALQTGQFLNAASTDLLTSEFGLLDQQFNTQYQIGRNKITAITGDLATAAQQTGIGTSAVGGALSSIGSGIATSGAYLNRQSLLEQQAASGKSYISAIGGIASSPNTFTTPVLGANPTIPSVPASYYGTPYATPTITPSSLGLGSQPTLSSSPGGYFGVLPDRASVAPVTATPISAELQQYLNQLKVTPELPLF